MKLSAKNAGAVMSKKLFPYSAAVVRLKVHRREEDYRVVLPQEDFPEQNSMLTRRVGNITASYGKGDAIRQGFCRPVIGYHGEGSIYVISGWVLNRLF